MFLGVFSDLWLDCILQSLLCGSWTLQQSLLKQMLTMVVRYPMHLLFLSCQLILSKGTIWNQFLPYLFSISELPDQFCLGLKSKQGSCTCWCWMLSLASQTQAVFFLLRVTVLTVTVLGPALRWQFCWQCRRWKKFCLLFYANFVFTRKLNTH